MKMTNSDLEYRIKRGMSDLTPDDAENIWEKPIKKAKGNEWYLDGTESVKKHKNTSKMIPLMSAVAACCVICFLSLYLSVLRADATIYFDVNPSVQLQINRDKTIISAEASNEDGSTILDGMDLKDTDLNVGVNALIGSMVKHGYLSEAKNVILLSVESRDAQKAERIRGELTEQIDGCLTNLIGSGVVLNQNIQVDKELKELSREYGMTPGKASFLKRIVEKHPELKYQTLAKMSMTELLNYLDAEDLEEEGGTFTGKFSPEQDDEEIKDREEDALELQQEQEEERSEAEKEAAEDKKEREEQEEDRTWEAQEELEAQEDENEMEEEMFDQETEGKREEDEIP